MQRLLLFCSHTAKIVMIRYAGILCISLLIICCKKNNSAGGSSGLYTEVSPFQGKTTINFIDSNEVVINGAQLNNPTIISGAYSYRIKNNLIYFIELSGNIKDTTSFYYSSSENNISLSSCAPGVPCYASAMPYVFSK